jgi:cytochrome c2
MAGCDRVLAAAAAGLAVLSAAAAARAADVAEGEAVFNRECSYCHTFSPSLATREKHVPQLVEPLPSGERGPLGIESIVVGRDKRGPHLQGLMQRAPGAVKGFPYRFVYRIEGSTWTATDLDSYILFHAGLDARDRANLIAFLEAMTGP